MVRYDEVAAAIAATGMLARGGFGVRPDDAVPDLPDGRPAVSVVMVGNVAGAMWDRFRAEQRDEPDPLDAWTRRTLAPVAARFGAAFVHPSDQPYPPVSRWAQRADDVWPSPIGLLVHHRVGLWHAYRGVFVFAEEVSGLPPTGEAVSPCPGCDSPCLTTCPVDAFTVAGLGVEYDHETCRTHVRSSAGASCLTDGCAARRACPVHPGGAYSADQMRFHMTAFVGDA